jgi:hypothetical protein
MMAMVSFSFADTRRAVGRATTVPVNAVALAARAE